MDESCIKLGQQAPDFSANSTFGPVCLEDYKGKWLVLFSHPGDFTPVCTTEFIAFAKLHPEFEKRNTCLLGLSIDSNPSHLAWVYNIMKNTGVQIPFPVISDRSGEIAMKYGMMPASGEFSTVRSVFIIDPEEKIRAMLSYPATNGRNIPEILRLIDALQITDKEKIVTPANWMPGQTVLVPSPATYEALLDRVNNSQTQGLSCMDWYLCFKNPSESKVEEKEEKKVEEAVEERNYIVRKKQD